MSLLIPNTASQLQQSGAIPVINISGGLSNLVYGHFGTSGAVPIEAFNTSGVTSGVFSMGLLVGVASSGRKMAETNRYGFDDGNENDQRLLTLSAMQAYDFSDFVVARLKVLRIGSGQTEVEMPVSGFDHALYTASVITSAHGVPAEVWEASDDDMFDSDQVLQAGARLYGFTPKGASGVWPRVRLTQSGQGISGIPHRLVVAFSGDIAQIGQGGNVAQVDGGLSDSRANADPTLNVQSRMMGLDQTDNDWVRIRATSSGQGISGIPHRLIVAFSGDPVTISGQSVQITEAGDIVSVNTSLNDSMSNGDNTLSTRANLLGYQRQSGEWSRLDAFQFISGDVVSDTSGHFGLLTASVIMSDNGAIAGINQTYTDSENEQSLITSAFAHGWNDGESGWSRLRVTQSGKGVSGIAHRLVVAFSGDIVQLAEGTSIAAVNDIASPNETNNTNSLVTTSFNYGRLNDEANQGAMYVTASGQGVSGIIHRLVVAFSGDNVFEHGSALITNPMRQATNASGGVILSSGSVFSVTVNSMSGNAPVWIGGTGSQAPFSGKGLQVYGGGSVSLKIDSVDDIRVFAEVSGQLVSWIGVQK